MGGEEEEEVEESEREIIRGREWREERKLSEHCERWGKGFNRREF